MLRIAAGLSALYLVWGSTYLAIRYVLVSLPPLGMSGVRFLLAGAVLYYAAHRQSPRGLELPPPRHWASAALVGLLLMGGGNGLIAIAEKSVTSGQTALLVATVPVWVTLWEWLRPGGKFPGLAVLAGLTLGTLGVVALVADSSSGDSSFLGSLLILLSAVFWTAGSLLTRTLPQPSSHLQFTAMCMLCGGVVLGLGSWATGEVWLSPHDQLLSSWMAWLYLVIAGSLVGMTLYTWLLRNASPMVVSTYSYVNPLVAVALAHMVGEELPARLPLAAGLIVLGVALVSLGRLQFSPRAMLGRVFVRRTGPAECR